MGSKERSLLPGGKKFEDLIILCKSHKLTGSKSQIQSQLPCILIHPNCQPKEENLVSTTRQLARSSSGSPCKSWAVKQKCSGAGHGQAENTESLTH